MIYHIFFWCVWTVFESNTPTRGGVWGAGGGQEGSEDMILGKFIPSEPQRSLVFFGAVAIDT